jgi:hypothetical protein
VAACSVFYSTILARSQMKRTETVRTDCTVASGQRFGISDETYMPQLESQERLRASARAFSTIGTRTVIGVGISECRSSACPPRLRGRRIEIAPWSFRGFARPRPWESIEADGQQCDEAWESVTTDK